MRTLVKTIGLVLFVFPAACSSSGGGSGAAAGPSPSEVAASVVSGGLNNGGGSTVAIYEPRSKSPALLERFVDALNPIGTASAATWSCTGGMLTPAFAGPGSYTFAPRTCSVTWDNGATGSSSWSGPFDLDYASACDDAGPFMGEQSDGCAATRTTASGGVTRSLVGPDGNTSAITHDTNGAGTGWDSSVEPAPSNAGLVLTCDSGGCSEGETLVVSGSHLTGTVTIGSATTTIWDHTVSSTGITVSGAGTARVATGSVTVQHNLLKYTATATFNSVGYGLSGCCFPTSGAVSTTYVNGTNVGKTETLSFSDVCGDATLTTVDGASESLTLEHCL
jgi:hypothetical protein